MNKKFSTLMVGALLASSTGAFAQGATPAYKTFPTATAAGTGAVNNIANGSVVRLQMAANKGVFDLNGAGATAKMDSLILGDAAVTGRSKAHVDSLLFKVGYKKVNKIYGANIGTENTFTFSNINGKFAFAKPAAGKVANAFVKADGAISEWILPGKYLSTNAANNGYAPYAIATRTSVEDATPLTVYVLAKLNAETDGNAQKTVQIVEVAYDGILEDEIAADANNLNIAYDKVTGKATFQKAAADDKTTHTLVTISGFSVAKGDLTFAVASADVKDVVGFEQPSFSFPNAAVTEGEANLLAAYNWEYTTDGYLKAVDEKLQPATKATEPTVNDQFYLTVDTMCYDEPNHQYFKLALDTVPATTSTKPIRNKELYEFTINANFGSDSISIIPKKIPDFTAGKFVDANGKIIAKAVTSASNVQAITIKEFAGKKVLTVLNDGDATPIAKIAATEEPTVELEANENEVKLQDGTVYTMRYMNTANDKYGKYVIMNNMVDRTAIDHVKKEGLRDALPSHQWVVKKEKKGYSLVNRETSKVVVESARFYTDSKVAGQLVSVKISDGARDTLKLDLIAANKLSPFDGYRQISKADQMNKKYTLRFNSELLGENAYVQQGEDSVMAVAINNKDKAIEVRFLQMGTDTTKLGVGLTAVPYAIKYDRFFLKYDSDKKVYRFTDKQNGEAYGEAENTMQKFLITKLIDGNWALVPLSVHLDNKVAIDSKNGNAVMVVLNSDLRHSFTIEEPEAPIFAQVLPKKDTTLVDVMLHSVENLGWKVAKGEDNFIYEGVPSLKLGGAEYEKAAFGFKLDTAYVNRTANAMPLYYITYNATRGDSVVVSHIHDNGKDHVCPTPLLNDTISGQYLFIMADSLENASRETKLKFSYTYDLDNSPYAKLQFVKAKHIKDTLIVNSGRLMSKDTLRAGDIKADARPEEIQGQWLGKNNRNKALFAFRINLDNKNEYAIYNPATDSYLSYLNGFLVATKQYASFYTLTDPNGGSVDNEKIEDAASTISVTAKVGAVEIAGAAGRRVVISNVLGQVIANTVITSDNAVIAAPAGVVVVAVEGEAAVKAIVK